MDEFSRSGLLSVDQTHKSLIKKIFFIKNVACYPTRHRTEIGKSAAQVSAGYRPIAVRGEGIPLSRRRVIPQRISIIPSRSSH